MELASRKEQKEALRQQRLATERAAIASEHRRRRIAYTVGGLLAAAAAVALVLVVMNGTGAGEAAGQGGGGFPAGSVPPRRITDLGAAAKAAGCAAKDFRSEGASHVSGPVRYASGPPHSGNHDPTPADDGAYSEAPRKESLVHELEHGRIIVWFSPTLAAEARGGLKALFDEDPYHMVLVPNRDMPFPVAASAWTHVLGCRRMDSAVFDAIRAFRDRYRDRGPEFVP